MTLAKGSVLHFRCLCLCLALRFANTCGQAKIRDLIALLPLHGQTFWYFLFGFVCCSSTFFNIVQKKRVYLVSWKKNSSTLTEPAGLCQVSNSLKIKLGTKLLQAVLSLNNLKEKKGNNKTNKQKNPHMKKLHTKSLLVLHFPIHLQLPSSSGVPFCQVPGSEIRVAKQCFKK